MEVFFYYLKIFEKKFLNPNIENTSILTKEELQKRGQQLQQERIQNGKKGGCC